MKGSGNGEPMQCVTNLLQMVRGECIYDRLKGIDPTLIDKNSESAAPLLVVDAEWLIRTYEPRVDVDNINIKSLLANEGGFAMNLSLNVTE